MADVLNIEHTARSSDRLNTLRSEMKSMFEKIDKIDDSILVKDPDWMEELDFQESKTKWGTLKSMFKKSKVFNMNSGVSYDSSMILSRDFVLNLDELAESPRFGDVQEPLQRYYSDVEPAIPMEKRYHLISLVSRKLQLATPKFEDMGKGSLRFLWEHFRSSFTR
ncbi:unnamed protein product [Kluyveromyces dobzhanskii CBS 2104]|uniref:WGS project CCBQ000000000 data, contig 00041 n=1 Tax=Kluyveromyces dobzhanskii CBS 2104 TaxID=1427455 RepID=A0A0A8L2V0_9SACH|nr:unnamed protein product [Kluyveromyces dobzhanskii CBS 2104]